MPDRRVLVVGTTPDYIDIINRRCPSRALFITDPKHRTGAVEPPPSAVAEIVCDLRDTAGVLTALRRHLDHWEIAPSGVVCFDCESMAVAAQLAVSLSLPYLTADAVAASRSKYLSKQLWIKSGVAAPEAALIRTEEELTAFRKDHGGSVVLKPLTGSGSELVFLCRDDDQCRNSFRLTASRLARHRDHRMYAEGGNGLDPRRVFVAERYIDGVEYSADFIIERGGTKIIRFARKIPDLSAPIGTILAYELPGELPPGLSTESLGEQFHRAATALGVQRAICMVDFIVRDGTAFILELTPRPGGDCLPWLILRSSGFDIWQTALDFAEGKPCPIPELSRWRRLIGLRLFAHKEGTITSFNIPDAEKDRRVLETYLKRRPGHRVLLPPDDYDSRLIGHVIFEPTPNADPADEIRQIASLVHFEMDRPSWVKPSVS